MSTKTESYVCNIIKQRTQVEEMLLLASSLQGPSSKTEEKERNVEPEPKEQLLGKDEAFERMCQRQSDLHSQRARLSASFALLYRQAPAKLTKSDRLLKMFNDETHRERRKTMHNLPTTPFLTSAYPAVQQS